MKLKTSVPKSVLIFFLALLLFACANKEKNVTIDAGKIFIHFDEKMRSQVFSDYAPNKTATENFSYSEYLVIENDTLKDFVIDKVEKNALNGRTVWEISGKSNGVIKIEKIITVTVYDDFPEFVFTKVVYKNIGNKPIKITAWVNNDYVLPEKDTAETIWSYQGASYEERPDWVLPVRNGFYRKNYLGMNATDYGGGVPVVDVWKRDYGLAVGHTEIKPKLVSLPVERSAKLGGTEIKVVYEKETVLAPQKKTETFETFMATHKGDYFHTLKKFSEFMRKHKGFTFPQPPSASYEPIWCAWGYEREFTVKQVLGTLPKVKELGYEWVVLDDGWQTAEGDWFLNPKKFPRGEKDMIAFVNKIHEAGLKAKLWWAPLAADPGTKLLREHSDMLLLDKNGKPRDITWWDSYYLCSAYAKTLEYTKKLVEKFIGEWGFDGLKIDGQHLNGAPPCYNPAHKHKRPEESTEAMPDFFKTIYETATKIKPDAVVEVCPCGTAYNYYMLPYVNQVVASDPVSSWQIRIKGKTFKALMGPRAPYYGDHVELSETKEDFASTVGVGGVIGTKFVWPVGSHINKESGDVSLTPAKEKKWRKWMEIYRAANLPQGEYLGELYDIGFDRPETHVIAKGDTLYYAFYADKFKGKIKLRGINENSEYIIWDYVNGKKIAFLPKGDDKELEVKFNGYLMLKAIKTN